MSQLWFLSDVFLPSSLSLSRLRTELNCHSCGVSCRCFYLCRACGQRLTFRIVGVVYWFLVVVAVVAMVVVVVVVVETVVVEVVEVSCK